MADVGARLADIGGSGTSEDQKTKYKAVVDALAASSDVGGLQATLTHLLSDAVPQVVSRNVVAHFARAVAAVAPPERLESICSWAGSYKEAACTLGGIDVETCSKPYADLDKAALVKIAEAFLEDDESVDAETYVNRASGLMHAVDGKVHWALQLRYRAVTCALLGNAGPQRSRILGLLYKDERVTSQMEQSDAFAAHARVLKRMFTGQVASRMIADGRLAAKLDQVDGVLHYADDAPPLARFDDSIAKICLAVNACYDKISALSDEATSAAAA
ncbi:hypothetical protein JL720_6505 [Aureococcus anophagefferens]|nr:hypothetical protein JL720_6505 [Aureococcus anophagefferens]